METVTTYGPEETFRLGERMGEAAQPGQVYCLQGDLGVGKTVFSQGFARGLGICEVVASPTFTILQSYEEGRLPLYHFDVYRISDVEEMEEIGYEDCFYGDGVSLVEWPDLVREILPEDAVWILIEKDLEQGFDCRQIRIGTRKETADLPGKGTGARKETAGSPGDGTGTRKETSGLPGGETGREG